MSATTKTKAEDISRGMTFVRGDEEITALVVSPIDVAGYSIQIVDDAGDTHYFTADDTVNVVSAFRL